MSTDFPAIDDLHELLVEAANDLLSLMLQDARDRLAEAYPPASQPGEYPHRRSGDLLASTNGEVIIEPGEVRLVMGSDMPYSILLEEGTETMEPRPMWGPLVADWQERVPQFLENKIAERFGI